MIASVTLSPRNSSAASFKTLQDDGRNLGRAVNAVEDPDMGVAVRGFDDLERHGLAHFLDLRRIVLSTDQPLDGIERVRRVSDGLAFGDLADKSFVLVGEADDGGRGAAAFFVGDDLHRAAFQNGDAAVRRAEIDSNYFAHNAYSLWDSVGSVVKVLLCGFHIRDSTRWCFRVVVESVRTDQNPDLRFRRSVPDRWRRPSPSSGG